MAYDLSQGLAALGSGIDSVTSAVDQYQKRAGLAALGAQLQSGDYAGAAQSAFKAGDVNTGLNILKLGQQKEQASSLGPLLGADPATYASSLPSSSVQATTGQSAAPVGGFGNAVARTLGFEGGLNRSDTNGTPSNYGINAAANPGVDVPNISKDQAVQIYKDKYWNAINGDNLSPALGHVAFDTAVIAGPGKANELLQSSGGDPNKYLALRDNFLGNLLRSNPEKYGKYANAWSDRSSALRADVQGASAGSGGIQVASNNPGFVPRSASAYAPAAAMPQGSQSGSDDDGGYAPQSVSAQQAIATRDQPAAPSAQQAQSSDDAKLANYQKYATALTLGIARTSDAGQREALKARLDWTNKQIDKLGKDDSVTTVDPKDYVSIPGLDPDYKGVVQKDSKGRLSFPGKPATQVNIDQKTKGIAETELAKAKIKDVTDAIEAGKDARTKLGTLNQLADVWNNNENEITTGPGAETVLKLKQLGKNLGVDVGNVAPSELVQKIGTQLASVASKDLTSRPTQFDFQTFLNNSPSLALTAQGNKFLINLMQQKAKNDLQLSSLARKQKDGDNWDDVVAQFDKEHPIISPLTGKPLDPNEVVSIGPPQAQTTRAPLSNIAPSDALTQARAAIAKGADKNAVIQRLRQNGIDAGGL